MNVQSWTRNFSPVSVAVFGGSRRARTLWLVLFCLGVFALLFISAGLMDEAKLGVNFMEKNIAPSWAHPFGTDWLGRDMLARTVKGLRISLGIGMAAALCSTIISLALGLAAATFGRRVDALVTGMVDVVMGTPHLVLLILISFSFGGGAMGVIVAVALSHWTRLARIVRAEILQLKTADYVLLSRQLGRSRLWIARHHMLPNLFPQFLVGLILLFPHAIMHAAGLTFLGFGLPPHLPAIGVLLSEAMRYLSTGYWWLAVAPGLALLFFVKLFDLLGGAVRSLTSPRTSQE
jgi:peptide/nickel transport system permease protein